jgi:predicted ferric reductase
MNTQLGTRPPTDQPRRLLPARRSQTLDTDLAWALGIYVAVITGIWIIHGGMSQFGDGTLGIATGVTQLTGLYASAAGLLGLLFAARPGILERHFGLDRLFNWHRVLGETMAVLVGVHVAAGVMAWQVDGHWGAVIADVTGRVPYFAGATVGTVLIGVVTVTSLKSIRNRLAYEAWYFLHLTAYLGFALSFGHTITSGTDFANDAIARWIWIGLHVIVAATLVWSRWGHTIAAAMHPLRVAEVRRVSHDVCTVKLTGGRLRRMRGSAGQFCFLRPLTAEGWWRCNPFSLSATPTIDGLRFSIKDRGDASNYITSLRVGTKIAVEGPYGVCTPEVAAGRKVVFVVGGIGIAPARALLEDLPATAAPVVLYRARSKKDLIHYDELAELAARTNGRVLTLVGPSATLSVKDPFSASSLRRAIPDVAERVAILCGPERLLQAARYGLKKAGVHSSDIHYEHSWW